MSAPAISSVRLTGVRALIARRMQQSLSESAQLTFTASFNAERLLSRAKQASKEHSSAGVGDVIAYCYTQQLVSAPTFNATLVDGTLHSGTTVNLGFALPLPTHLVVPVMQGAETLSIAELATMRSELSSAAIHGTLAPADMQGATSTVSNLGRGRVDVFTPILNAPQVALLGVASIQPKPWVGTDGALCVARVGTLSLTVDHRVIDGAPANTFLSALCDRLEQL